MTPGNVHQRPNIKKVISYVNNITENNLLAFKIAYEDIKKNLGTKSVNRLCFFRTGETNEIAKKIIQFRKKENTLLHTVVFSIGASVAQSSKRRPPTTEVMASSLVSSI